MFSLKWAAIEQYRRHGKELGNPYVNEFLERITADEYCHIRLLNEALRKFCRGSRGGISAAAWSAYLAAVRKRGPVRLDTLPHRHEPDQFGTNTSPAGLPPPQDGFSRGGLTVFLPVIRPARCNRRPLPP